MDVTPISAPKPKNVLLPEYRERAMDVCALGMKANSAVRIPTTWRLKRSVHYYAKLSPLRVRSVSVGAALQDISGR
jgi:hypothetical protein